MTQLLTNIHLILTLVLCLTTFKAQAEESGRECQYEVKLWGKLKSGPGVTDQDRLHVSVIGEVREGKSVWYSVVRRPGTEPDLIPQIALEQPYPSGTCLSYVASIKNSIQEAWSDNTSALIHENDIEFPDSKLPRKPIRKQPDSHSIALGAEESGTR